MTAKNLLEQFLQEDQVESYLYENSGNDSKITLLQLCLNDLGFGTELKFQKFGADGFYGTSTIRAVKAFAEQNNFESDGKKVTTEMLEKMISLKETETSKALNQFLTQIRTTDTITMYLSNGSKYKNEIVILQIALHNIGYGIALNWEKFGADGDYGQSTIAGVLAFAQKNNFESNGEEVTLDMFKKIAELDEVAPHLRTLNETIIAKANITKESDAAKIRALQSMLHFLGYDTELNWEKFGADGGFGSSTTAAVEAYTTKENLTFDGTDVTPDISEHIIGHYESGLGDDWKTVQNHVSFDELTVQKIGTRTYEVSDGILTQRFTKTSLQGFSGMGLQGKQTIKTFVKNHKDLLENHEISDSSLNIIQAVEVNEGKLDAINSYDSAYFSFGIFQWTIGTKDGKGELPALLKKIKIGNPNIFQKYFGAYKLNVSDSQTNTTYGYLTLDNQLIRKTSQKQQFRDPRWAFIFWKAAQDPIIQSFEIEHAIARFKNFYWKKNTKYLQGHSISEYITSEYGVALLLDQNVNRPNDVYVYTKKALDATGLKNPETWTTTDENRLIDKYISLRNHSNMWDPKKRADRTTAFVKNGFISDQRHSFQYNVLVSRGVNMVEPPTGFNQEDYPDMTENKEQHSWTN